MSSAKYLVFSVFVFCGCLFNAFIYITNAFGFVDSIMFFFACEGFGVAHPFQ